MTRSNLFSALLCVVAVFVVTAHASAMYNPVEGRFIQLDPAGFRGGDFNLYRYVGNRPTVFADSSGEQSFLPAPLPLIPTPLLPLLPLYIGQRHCGRCGCTPVDHNFPCDKFSLGRFDVTLCSAHCQIGKDENFEDCCNAIPCVRAHISQCVKWREPDPLRPGFAQEIFQYVLLVDIDSCRRVVRNPIPPSVPLPLPGEKVAGL